MEQIWYPYFITKLFSSLFYKSMYHNIMQFISNEWTCNLRPRETKIAQLNLCLLEKYCIFQKIIHIRHFSTIHHYQNYNIANLETHHVIYVYWETGGISVQTCCLISKGIPVLKIRGSHDCIIFNIGVPIPGRTVFILRQDPAPIFLGIHRCIANPSISVLAPGGDCWSSVWPRLVNNWKTLHGIFFCCNDVLNFK